MRDHLLNKQDLIHEVAGEKVRHRLNSEIGDAIKRANTAEDCVVEQNVDATPFSHNGGGKRGNRRDVDEIHWHDQRALTALFNFLCGAFEASGNRERGFLTY